MDINQDEQGASAWADLLVAIVLVGVGLFVFYEAFNIPRLEARRIHPLTAPGFTPMILSAVLTVLGAVLGIRAWRKTTRPGFTRLFYDLGTLEMARALAALALFVILIFVLLGNMPFWLATMLFMFAFIVVLETVLSAEPVPLLRSMFWAAVVSVPAALGITYLFTSVFLVRLP